MYMHYYMGTYRIPLKSRSTESLRTYKENGVKKIGNFGLVASRLDNSLPACASSPRTMLLANANFAWAADRSMPAMTADASLGFPASFKVMALLSVHVFLDSSPDVHFG